MQMHQLWIGAAHIFMHETWDILVNLDDTIILSKYCPDLSTCAFLPRCLCLIPPYFPSVKNGLGWHSVTLPSELGIDEQRLRSLEEVRIGLPRH